METPDPRMWILDQLELQRQSSQGEDNQKIIEDRGLNYRQKRKKLSHWSEKQDFRHQLQRRLKDTQGLRCCWCSRELNPPRTGRGGDSFTMDHIVPDSYGGPLLSFNLLPACKSCNSTRGNKSALDFYRQRVEDGKIPQKEAIINALRRTLEHGDINAKYSLYYIASQLDSPEFSAG